jgi:hypothetical protein
MKRTPKLVQLMLVAIALAILTCPVPASALTLDWKIWLTILKLATGG